MIRILLCAVVGAALAGTVAWIVSGDDAWSGLVIPCAIVFSFLLPLVLVFRGLAGIGGGLGLSLGGGLTPADVQRADAEGRLALARVKAISRTGTSINDQPVCDLDLLVVPRFGQPFEVRTRRLVDLVEIPRLQPESVVVVAMSSPAPSAVTIVMDPPDDWVLQAQSDDDVRTTRSAPPFTLRPDVKARPGLRRIPPILYVVGAVVGAALALIPAYSTIGALASGDTTLDDVRYASSWEGKAEAEQRAEDEAEAAASMFVDDNASRAVQLLIDELGSSQVTRLAFWSTNLSAEAPSAPGAQTLDSYHVSGGEVDRGGASGSQPEPGELEASLFDAAPIDYSIMPALIAEAKELSGLPEPDPDGPDQWVHLSVQNVSGFDERLLTFDVPIDGEYYDAWITFSLTGEVLDMRGGAPGSASYEAEHATD